MGIKDAVGTVGGLFMKPVSALNNALVGRRGAHTSGAKALTAENMNPHLKEMKYAVRGEVPITAEKIQKELSSGSSKRPYSEILYCNIGNPHSVGQQPITWYRQVLSLVNCPTLMDSPEVLKAFPSDVVERSKKLKALVKGGTGAYSHSKGVEAFRNSVAAFVEKRDGYPCDPESLYLTGGASSGIEKVLTALISGPKDAVLIPIPQYPLYSALITILGGKQLGYYLEEEKGWGFDINSTREVIHKARRDGLKPKAFCVINPGNPTGQLMTQADLSDIVKLCKEEGLVLLADEVYQENVYAEGKKFVSMKKAVRDLGDDYAGVELASFHSTSKGLIGECGRRGGYMELCGFDPAVVAEIFKHCCMGLCPNLDGQIMTELMVNPPKPGEPSYDLFTRESTGIYNALKTKAKMLHAELSAIPGVSCQNPEGAMYAFPQIMLPPKAIAAAEAAGKAPDLFYCLALLEETGICCVPGSGFLQKPGTFHFRTTFLPPEEKLKEALGRFKKFHAAFLAKYQ
mmetsp:Transcript_27798/g.60801  ORF Transcript_27798/g.60801 Transcript_27798/m.60801 type:complete len:515 (-) Transcript_27798:349-1893(-)|eukprot:CAMPEP_0118934864 /NCGR_PEP_ID=MMETSP1169-20130426/14331_1 /TAXON_ID=36882 /ORGANISM="Pyramimonas obovata, Strain CCMP722" /LENGTH=514 /DNA_ID=CAMNT_0006877813 /DNA_START=188 /DNA_END=1732 /DNA_ORIENTATION=-